MIGEREDWKMAKPQGEETGIGRPGGTKRKASSALSSEKTKVARVVVSLRQADYARYGVVEGVVCGSMNELKRSECGVIARAWPSWAFGAQGAGLKVKFIILFDERRADLIRRCLPGVTVVNMNGSEVKEEGCKGLVRLEQVDIVFSDMDPPGVVDVWNLAQRTLVSSRRCRRIAPGWKEARLTIPHHECGGVTDEEIQVHVYNRDGEECWGLVSLPAAGKRDLSSILDPRARHGVPCNPPSVVQLRFPAIVRLAGRSTYHGGGWLPGSKRDLNVITSNGFSPTNWCKRKLSNDEWLQVMDFPLALAKTFTDKEKADLAKDTAILPLKIVGSICQHFCFVPGQEKFNQGAEMDAGQAGALDLVQSGEGTKSKDLVDRMAKATKDDDADVPEYLWDDRLFRMLNMEKTSEGLKSLRVLRAAVLCIWKRLVTRSYIRWCKAEYNKGQHRVGGDRVVRYNRDRRRYEWTAKGLKQYRSSRNQVRAEERLSNEVARDALRRGSESSWWEWTEGSTPFFWRWPAWHMKLIRDGSPPLLKGRVPKYILPQRVEKDERIRAAVKEKLKISIDKGYLEKGKVVSLTSFFAVPKGPTDIRLVYDGTRSGLNEALYAPWFPLPTVNQLLRAVESGSYMGDIDVAEMFLNFVMHKDMRVYCGVDVTSFFPEKASKVGDTVWYRWGRCGMGFANSPYVAVQGIYVAEEVILGDHNDPSNIFRWDSVELNLPGMAGYCPSKPWVAKMRLSDGRIACDVFIYVDDLRTSGPTETECWEVSRRVASCLNWLGLQDAARKRRPPSQEPGAWSGSIVHSSSDQVEVLVSQERWDKAKSILSWIRAQMTEFDNTIDFKILESHRGYLVYISRTYPSICPYLKGVHQTLDSWRPWRREDGWKMSEAEIRVAMEEEEGETHWRMDYTNEGKAPTHVKAAPRLGWDLEALEELFKGDSPTRRRARPGKMAVATYGFGDASGKGFGSSLSIRGDLYYRHGQWADQVEEESSNYRELSNLVLTVEEAVGRELLRDCELFLFTDNSTAEGAYYRGTSGSRLLFELVLRLRVVEIRKELVVHVIHVAGTRMIEVGVDGLSRGCTHEGIMTGRDLLEFIPLHLTAFERESALQTWVMSWANGSGESYQVLTPNDWFCLGQTRNKCLWAPPPAAADVAVDLLGKAKHKRPRMEHIFICPRLMTNRWRKQLSKVCDVIFTIPVGTHMWGVRQHEPLLVGIAFPLANHRPWRLKGTPILERTVRDLSEVPTVAADWGGDILRKLLECTRGLDALSERMVWEVLQSSG